MKALSKKDELVEHPISHDAYLKEKVEMKKKN